MRPTKLTANLLQAFQSVLTDELAAIAFTEEELVWQANQQLPVDERISYRTYQRYKADILYMEEEGIPDGFVHAVTIPDDADDDAELVRQMYVCLKDALMKQKLALVRGIYEARPNWRRYTWMLERKFPDFRLKPLAMLEGKRAAGEKVAGREDSGTKATGGKSETEKQRDREAWFAKMAAETAASKPKTVEEKWEQCYHQPWKPMHIHAVARYSLEHMRELETEMERDVAAGYVNPYAHLGYRPDMEMHDDGFYCCFGMGEDRLPLRVHLLRACDEPRLEERETMWNEQERNRKNIIRAEQGLPPLEPPIESMGNGQARRLSGCILGHSGG